MSGGDAVRLDSQDVRAGVGGATGLRGGSVKATAGATDLPEAGTDLAERGG